ncbi:TolC family protein [Xylophilus sp. GW821-FHT01B05]
MSIRQLIAALCLGPALPALAQVPPVPPVNPPPASTTTAAAAPRSLTLGQTLAAARDNLDVAISRGALSAARADVLTADHAPLPVLSGKTASIDLQNGVGSGNTLSRKRIDKAIGIDWTWERGGKRQLRTQAAQRDADAAAADVEDVQMQQQVAALGAYYDLLAAQEKLVEVSEIERSAAQLANSSNRRVQAGDLPAQDALRTEIEAQRAQADVQQAALERDRATLALAQATGLRGPLAIQGPWPTLPALATPAADYTALAEARPEVRAALARVQSAQAGLDGANALKKSDVTIGASYDHYPSVSNRLIELRASIPLQWGYSYQGEIGRAQATYTQAQDALEKVRRDAALELQGLQQAALTAEQRARSYETDILPRARRVAENAELAFRRGAIPLVDLLDARRTLRATLLDGIAARGDYARAAGAWTLQTQPALLAAQP